MFGMATLILSFLCIIWLLVRDRKLRPMTSRALWIPLLWVMIIGSRSFSGWFAGEVDPGLAAVTYLEGSPADRNLYLSLIIAGAFILWRRRLDWGKIINSNPWLFALIFYFGVSAVWSDYRLVSLKAWVKDLGNIIMILILLSESDRAAAIKAVFARYGYFALLLSLVLILSFPELGSYYSSSTGEISYSGVTRNKNEFGQILVICGVFLVRDLMENLLHSNQKTGKVDLLIHSALLVVVIWLMKIAGSSTAVACLALGTVILIAMQFPPVRSQVRHLGMYLLALIPLVLVMNIPFFIRGLVEVLGRDLTFTGRTDIWRSLLSEPVNPLLGTGFHSFWVAPGVMEDYGNISQAHNGYLETYLNGGFVGVLLLVAMIVSAGIKLKVKILQGSSLGVLFFAFFIVGIFVNLTEAMFNRLNLVWFVFLLASLDYPLSHGPMHDVAADNVASRRRGLRYQRNVRCVNGR